MIHSLMFKAFCLGAAGAAGASIGRSAVEGSRKRPGRMTSENPYHAPIVYPKSMVACPCCGGVFTIERLANNAARLEIVREPDPETLPESEGHVGIREDLVRRGRSDRGDLIRSQMPRQG